MKRYCGFYSFFSENILTESDPRFRPLNMREIKEEAKDIVYMDEINHECTLACPPGPVYVVWLQQSIVTNHISHTAFIHVFLYSCIWIGKLFNSHIFGTNLTYCHWFEHNGEYFLNFLRRFSGFWKSICQRPSWISWSFRNNLSMEYTMYIIHARKYTIMICEVTTGGKDWPQVDQGGVL